MSLAHHDEHGKGGAQVKLLSQKDIIEKLDGTKVAAEGSMLLFVTLKREKK
jgi:hypothetical protein